MITFLQRLIPSDGHISIEILGKNGRTQYQKLSSIKDRLINVCLSSKDVSHQRLSSSKVVFHQRLSSIKVSLPSKFVFNQKNFFIKDRLPSRVINHLPSKLVDHIRSSSIKGCLPSMVVFHQRSSSVLLDTMWYTMFMNVPIANDHRQTGRLYYSN